MLTLDRRAGVPVSYPVPLAFNWPVFGGIGVVLALLFAAFTIYAVFAAGAREPSERLRLISWAIDGASEEWTLANAWQHMAPGQPVPAEAALLPAELSQRLLDQAAWDNVGGNPTKESVKTALQGAALYCLARDYSGCLKPVVQSAAATQGNSMTFAKQRSKGVFMVPTNLNAPANFILAASIFTEQKARNGPTRAEAVLLAGSLCVRRIPFDTEGTVDGCRQYMRALLECPETREAAQRKLDAMSGWRWSWVSKRLNAAVPSK